MLKPEIVKPVSSQCRHVRSDIIDACIPDDMGFEIMNGSIRFFSSSKHVSGLISKGKNSGYETQIKSVLNKPFNRMMSGDLSSKSTAEIMKNVFEKRYNPVFFGVRADIVPRWMRGDDTACIIFPEGADGIGFLSSSKQMGLVFDKKGLIVIQVDGSPDKPFLSFLMGTVNLLREE
ncbi:MAG TPA: hypothetical protein VIS94_08585 [Desulfomonilia bacterium]